MLTTLFLGRHVVYIQVCLERGKADERVFIVSLVVQ